eukprot:1156621-Pelagomonas_calceolata.AAC.4
MRSLVQSLGDTRKKKGGKVFPEVHEDASSGGWGRMQAGRQPHTGRHAHALTCTHTGVHTTPTSYHGLSCIEKERANGDSICRREWATMGTPTAMANLA